MTVGDSTLLRDRQSSPRVSIVMPTYRRAHMIGKTIRSVLDQTYGNFELLVRDDGSCRETEAVVAAFHDPRIQYHPNGAQLGMPQNLNEGIRIARGEYILVCHDHDLYDKTMVEKMVRFLDAHPTALFVHAGVAFVDLTGRPTGRQYVMRYAPLTAGKSWLNRMLSRFDCLVCANSMVRRRAYEEHGRYNPDFGFIADVEMWMRLCCHGDAGYIAEPLISIREREKDHEYSGISWQLVDTIIRIHKLYHDKVFSGIYGQWRYFRLKVRMDRYLLLLFLSCLKRRDKSGITAGRQYLKESGALLSRSLAYLL